MNKQEVIYGMVFYLDYYGVNLFIQVNHTEWEYFYAFEVKTKKIAKDKEIIEWFKPKKDGHCLYVPNNVHNDATDKGKTLRFNRVRLDGEDMLLELKIEPTSELYKQAKRINQNSTKVAPGTYYAVLISETPGFENWYYKYNGGDIPRKDIKKEDLIWKI